MVPPLPKVNCKIMGEKAVVCGQKTENMETLAHVTAVHPGFSAHVHISTHTHTHRGPTAKAEYGCLPCTEVHFLLVRLHCNDINCHLWKTL
jgi:hypothetical protein